MESYLVDAYKVLGLTKDVESSAIRSAYKKLALKCHPDKVQGSEEFKAEKRAEWDQIQKAYEQLGDDVKRAKYDKERPTKEYLHFLRREKETRPVLVRSSNGGTKVIFDIVCAIKSLYTKS